MDIDIINSMMPHKSNLFSKMIKAAYGIDMWCFAQRQRPELLESTNEEKNILYAFLQESGALSYINEKRDIQRPVFFSDALGCVWVGEWVREDSPECGGLLFVIGPVLYGIETEQNLENRLKEMHYSQTVLEPLLNILRQLPTIDPKAFMSLAVMLHYIITAETISISDCIYQTETQSISNGHSEYSEEEKTNSRSSMERSAETEEYYMRVVREGNVAEAKLHLSKKMIDRSMDLKTNDPIRDMKDAMIIFTALCSRAAIEGGLSPKLAKSIERHYLSAIEAAKMVTALTEISVTMYIDFTQRVHNVLSGPEISKQVNECCAYIQTHLEDEIDLSDMASAIGYTKYYLSKKFTSEMGMKIADYIKQQRIRQAKAWLVQTSRSIQDISDTLRFSSRNYFTKVFQETEGATPKEYRMLNTRRGGKI